MEAQQPTFPPPEPPPSLSITPEVPELTLAELVVIIVFTFIATICVIGRAYLRIKKYKHFYFNDYAIFFAWIWAAGLAFTSIGSILQGGTGHHMAQILQLAPERVPTMFKLFLASQFCWALANSGVKMSILDLYIKIFGADKQFRRFAHILMVGTAAYCLLVILIAFLICHPFAFNWNHTIPGGSCGNQKAAFLVSGIINLVLDICVITLPLPKIWQLQLAVGKKVGLSLMFCVGFLICAITIWRMVAIEALTLADVFYKAAHLGITSCLEPLLGIANACFPILHSALALLKSPFSEAWTFLTSLLKTGSKSRLSRYETYTATPVHLNSQKSVSNPRSLGSVQFSRLYGHLYSKSDLESKP